MKKLFAILPLFIALSCQCSQQEPNKNDALSFNAEACAATSREADELFHVLCRSLEEGSLNLKINALMNESNLKPEDQMQEPQKDNSLNLKLQALVVRAQKLVEQAEETENKIKNIPIKHEDKNDSSRNSSATLPTNTGGNSNALQIIVNASMALYSENQALKKENSILVSRLKMALRINNEMRKQLPPSSSSSASK